MTFDPHNETQRPGPPPAHHAEPDPPSETILWPPWEATNLPAPAPPRPPTFDRHGLPRETFMEKVHRIARGMSKVLFLASLITGAIGIVSAPLGVLLKSYEFISDLLLLAGCFGIALSISFFAIAATLLILWGGSS